MKATRILTSIAWLVSTALSSAAHYQVYLLGGQSNGVGRGDAAQLTAPLNTPQTDVLFYWHRTQSATNTGHLLEDQWIDLAPGSGLGTGEPVYPMEFGSEVSFGRAMADAKPTENIAFIKYAHGGTTLAVDWAPSGAKYTTFVSTVQAGLAALTSAGHTYELKGMLWMQGETDTKSLTRAAAYETNLTNLVARVRADLFSGGSLPFVIGSLSDSQLSDITTPGTGSYKVRQAQEAVAAADAKVGIVITDGYSVRSDVIHFDHTAQITIGQDFVAELLVLEGPDMAAPQLSGTNPGNGTANVSIDNNLVATFNETIQKGASGDIVIKQSGGAIFETIAVTNARISISGAVMTIDPAGAFTPDTAYYVQIADGAIEDLAGNPWAGIADTDTTTWNFSTTLTGTPVGTTGIFDENINASNQLDIQIPESTLAPFKSAVLTAYDNNLGGVIDWETGISVVANNSLAVKTLDGVAVTYGASGSNTLSIAFDRDMDLYTSDINSQVLVLSQQGVFHNAIIAGGGNDPVGLQYTMTFSGADIIELGAAMPSRSTYGALGVDFRATVNYNGGGSAVTDFTIGGTKGTGDTFLHFAAPAGETITSLTFAYMDDNGQGLANGQRRPTLDDLGFIAATPSGTLATWLSNAAFGLEPEEQGIGNDPDGDNIPNGVEAWFGTHPGESSAGLANLASDGLTTTTFTHPLNVTPPSDISGFYTWSQDLTDWYSGNGEDGPDGGPTLLITVDAVGTNATVTAEASEVLERLFLRAGVEQN